MSRRPSIVRPYSASDGAHNFIVQAASLSRPASGTAVGSRPPVCQSRPHSGLRSQPDLRIRRWHQTPLSSGSQLSSALLPAVVRGVSAGSVGSVAPAAAEMAAVVLQARSGSKARPSSADSHMTEFLDDDDVSRWTASSCSTFRGHRPDSAGSHKSSQTTTQRQLRTTSASRQAQRKPWRARSPENFNTSAVCCPRGHELLSVHRDQGWFCRGCGRVSPQTRMECYRCKRCNYNLCDQCYSLQASENDVADSTPSPPLLSRPESLARVASAARSIELLAQRAEDGMLPDLPPAFSRALSPPSRVASPPSIRPASGQSNRSEKHTQWSSSRSPREKRTATASTRISTRRSSSVSSSSSHFRFSGFSDPLLRIIPLMEWPADGRPAEDEDKPREEAKQNDDSADIELIDAALACQGHALRPGSPSPEDRQRRLDKVYLEHLCKMSKNGSLRPEDVEADLKIWHLTLLRRPARKRIIDLWGRVDPRLQARLAKLDAENSHEGCRNNVSNRRSSSSSAPDHLPSGQRVGGHRDKRSGGISGSQQSLSNSRFQDASLQQESGGAPCLVNGDPSLYLFGASGVAGLGNQSSNILGEDGQRSSGRKSNEEALSEDADLFSAQWGERWEKPDGRSSQAGTPSASTLPTAGTSIQNGGQSPSGQQAVKSRASFMPVAGASAAQQVHSDGSPKNDDQGEEGREEEDSLDGGEPEYPTVQLFSVKTATNQTVDEFAKMLLPPAPTAGMLADSLQTTPSGSGHASARDDAEGHGEGSEESVLQGLPVVQKEPPVIEWFPGVRKSLADEFKVSINEAWLKLEESQDDGKDEVARTMNHLRRTSKQASRMLETSEGGMADMNDLDAFVRGSSRELKVERYARHLQHRAEKSLKTEDRWFRRQKACQQSLKSLGVLSMFAELQRRQPAVA